MTAAAEAVAAAAFAAERMTPSAWSNAPGTEYAEHAHPADKVLYCIDGSIAFFTTDGDLYMEAGDRLDLPAGTAHRAKVGPNGVTCWEAYRR